MIKLLHLADVHLGKTFRMLGQRGVAQRRALQAAFERAVSLALERGVHVVLIAGDLFDTPKPSETLVKFVTQQLRLLDDAGITTVLVAGNHDVGTDGRIGPANQLRGAGSRLLLVGTEPEVLHLADHDLTVVARSAVPGISESPLKNWPRRGSLRFAVGVAHGSTYRAGQVEGPHVIHPQEIRDLGLDYLALGDWHSNFEVHPAPTTAWYAGSPEWLAFDQPGSGQVLLVEVSEPGAANVIAVQVGRRRYVRQEFDAAEVDEAKLRSALEAVTDPDLVYEAVLTGLMPLHQAINVEVLERDLAEGFFRLRITNRARVWLDETALDAFPPQTVLGRFVRLMRDRLAQAPDEQRGELEEALQVGAALLAGRDEVLV